MVLGGPPKPSHLREVSAASVDSPTQASHSGHLEQPDDGNSTPTSSLSRTRQCRCTLWVHDEAFSREEFLSNQAALNQAGIAIGDIVEIRPVQSSTDVAHGGGGDGSNERSKGDNGQAELMPSGTIGVGGSSASASGGGGGGGGGGRIKFKTPMQNRCLFMVKPLPQDIKSRYPRLEISLSINIANIFGFKNRSQVFLTTVDQEHCSASHVEISFRDEYLVRSDMWQLVMSELTDRTVYKGQKIVFMGSVKATVKNIFIQGMKVLTGYFSSQTIPVFRSESAKYVLFIQMSREMWDFDSEGTGDILFSRVIDGFLPELFKRWASIGARHVVTIVLFTRVEYDMAAGIGPSAALISERMKLLHSPDHVPTRDFYRVVVNDMASGHWTAILDELKKDFRTFLRDVSILKAEDSVGGDGNGLSKPQAWATIVGRPSTALRGNFLEAIHLASSHLAHDHIDRDMERTGNSIVVITPGSGVFESFFEALASTTEALTNQGIAIDLVCLSPMPLHSTPLIKYRNPAGQPTGSSILSDSQSRVSSSLPELLRSKGSFANESSPASSMSTTRESSRGGSASKDRILPAASEWNFGIPHWLDVSYWNPETYRESRRILKQDPNAPIPFTVTKRSKVFVPRVRMYEIQMMGVMESEQSNISIPYLVEGQAASRHLALRGFGSSPLQARVSSKRGPSYRGHSSDNSLRPELFLPSIPNPKDSTVPIGRKKQRESVLAWMDNYDDVVFRQFARPRRPASWNSKPTAECEDTSKKSMVTVSPKSKRNKSTISRSMSYALRGLVSTPPRAQASTRLSVEPATAGNTLGARKNASSVSSSDTASLSTVIEMTSKSDTTPPPPPPPPPKSPAQETSVMTPSRPISIRKPSKRTDADPEPSEPGRDAQGSASTTATETPPYHSADRSVDGDARKPPVLKFDIPAAHASLRDGSSKDSPSKALAPWVRSVNPCNTSKAALTDIAWFGRWQHAYPRPPRVALVKWKSLKTPAILPLTTEEFPSASSLSSDYLSMSYRVSLNDGRAGTETQQERDSLLRSMVSLRLSRGFQIVVGQDVAKESGQNALESLNIFDRRVFERNNLTLFLSQGSSIHRIACVDGDEIEVTTYTHKAALSQENDEEKVGSSSLYQAYVRTILSKEYTEKELPLGRTTNEYNWNYADNYVSGHRDYILNPSQQLHFWRVRYVLIPMRLNVGSSRRRPQAYNEDNEEEIHLLGIVNLTRIWQRHKYIPPEEKKKVEASSRRIRPDENPLNITFWTGNPSDVVTAERDGLMLAENPPTPLLPESEQLERSDVGLGALAQIIQGDKGVRMMDRRWHWRLHYNCFIGFEFTTWLLQNFSDIETREQAVEYGNDLMKQGLFVHVEKRHNFRDGNYFYQISSEYRAARPESRGGWFSSQKRPENSKSVPTTPGGESLRRDTPSSSGHGRSDSGEDNSGSVRTQSSPAMTDGATPTTGGKAKTTVMLSKSLKYDVDPRKRSYRPEVVDLHYDRLHNPENCFHIELNWMITTPKLIEDSVASWTSIAERYGLNLVQVPIAEASAVGGTHCFRRPHRVTLKVPPPPGPSPPVYSTTSFAETAGTPDRLYFQRKLLRRFEFVLDFESSSAFPADVEVSYSWGKPNYTCSQYIHRSGSLLAQITDEGEFLFLANRLVGARNSIAGRDGDNGSGDSSNRQHDQQFRGRSGATVEHNRLSASSPLLQSSGEGGAMNMHGPSFGLDAENIYTEPESLVSIFEGFCSDSTRLEQFYAEPQPTQARATSSRFGPTAAIPPNIPSLELPARLVGNQSLPNLGVPTSPISSDRPAATGAGKTGDSAAANVNGPTSGEGSGSGILKPLTDA